MGADGFLQGVSCQMTFFRCQTHKNTSLLPPQIAKVSQIASGLTAGFTKVLHTPLGWRVGFAGVLRIAFGLTTGIAEVSQIASVWHAEASNVPQIAFGIGGGLAGVPFLVAVRCCWRGPPRLRLRRLPCKRVVCGGRAERRVTLAISCH